MTAARIKGLVEAWRNISPTAAVRAGQCVNRVLAPIHQSIWPEVAWRFSRLGPRGFPLEAVWSSTSPALRWTAEAGAPEDSPCRRVSRALEQLPARPTLADLPASWADWPRRARRFGAYLGGRHTGRQDSFKIYLEVGDEHWQPKQLTTFRLGALRSRINWRMVGWSPDYDSESYGAISRVQRQEVFTFSREIGSLAGYPWRLLEQAIDTELSEIPGVSGLSLAQRHGRVTALTIFVRARQLLGSDKAIMKAVDRLARSYGWSHVGLSPLRDVATGSSWLSGMLGLGVSNNGPFIQLSWLPAEA